MQAIGHALARAAVIIALWHFMGSWTQVKKITSKGNTCLVHGASFVDIQYVPFRALNTAFISKQQADYKTNEDLFFRKK